MIKISNYLIKSSTFYTFNEFLDRALEKINKNSNYCLETMVSDFDQMQSLEDFVHVTPVKRKRKATPIEKPQKKKIKRKIESKLSPVKPVVIGKILYSINLFTILTGFE